MTSAEKRYFKKDTRDSNTSLLFDLINEQSSYDEVLIKKKLKDKSFAKNLKVHKNRLQQILLKNLRAYYEEKSAHSKIKVLIENAEILLSKQLHDLAFAQLEKALAICEDFEEYELKLLILSIVARMSSFLTGPSTEKLGNPLLQMEKCAKSIQNYAQHAILNDKIIYFLKDKAGRLNTSDLHQHIAELLDHEIIAKERLPLSPMAERMYLHSQALVYKTEGNHERAYQLTKEILRRFEENPYIIEEKSSAYFDAIVNHVDSCNQKQSIEELEYWLSKAQHHANCYEHLLPNMLYIYKTFFSALRTAKQYNKLKAYLETDVLPLIETYQLKEEQLVKTTLSFALETYLILDEYDKLEQLLQQLLAQRKGLSKQLRLTLFLFEMIYHFEQQNYERLEQLANTHQKRIRRNNEQLPFFEAAISFFKHLSLSNIRAQNNHLQLHRTAVPKYQNDWTFQYFKQFFNYTYWLDAQIRKIPLAQILIEKDNLKRH